MNLMFVLLNEDNLHLATALSTKVTPYINGDNDHIAHSEGLGYMTGMATRILVYRDGVFVWMLKLPSALAIVPGEFTVQIGFSLAAIELSNKFKDERFTGHRMSQDQSTVVSKDVYWYPIDDNTPYGVKVWALTVGHIGVTAHLTRDNVNGYLGWYPIPRESPEMKGKGLGYRRPESTELSAESYFKYRFFTSSEKLLACKDIDARSASEAMLHGKSLAENLEITAFEDGMVDHVTITRGPQVVLVINLRNKDLEFKKGQSYKISRLS